MSDFLERSADILLKLQNLRRLYHEDFILNIPFRLLHQPLPRRISAIN